MNVTSNPGMEPNTVNAFLVGRILRALLHCVISTVERRVNGESGHDGEVSKTRCV